MRRGKPWNRITATGTDPTMNRLYVRFAGDNDFSNTVEAFVKAVAPNILLDCWQRITKEEIVQLFNDHAFSLYALHQCRKIKADEGLRSYLELRIEDVYFDDEIDDFTNHNNDGCLAVLEHDGIGYYVM